MSKFSLVLITGILSSLLLQACGSKESTISNANELVVPEVPHVSAIQDLSDSLALPDLDSLRIHLTNYQDFIRGWYKSEASTNEHMAREMEIVFETQRDNYQMMRDFYEEIKQKPAKKEKAIQYFKKVTTYWEEIYEKMNPKASNLYEEIIKAKRTFVNYHSSYLHERFSRIRQSQRSIF